MSSTGLLILGLVNLPVYFVAGKLIFKSWDSFWESIMFWLTPDLFSAFNGQYWEDWVGELKLGLWLACCIGCVYGEHMLIEKLFM